MHKLDTESICSIILFSWMAIIIAWERIAPYRKGLPFFREGFWIDFVWYTLIQSFFLKIIIFDYIIQPLSRHLDLSQIQFVKDWPVWTQVLFFLVTHDLYIYSFHRLQHASKFLWRTHEAHHSGKEVDFLAGSRSHVMEIIINQTIEFAPIILLGAAPEVVPIKAMLDAVFGMFIHANINVKLGKWKYFFNSPELHLWHHANYQEVFHANFSTKFSVWDHLFGTVYDPGHPPGNLPENWGLPYDYPRDYFLQHAFSVKRFDERRFLKNPLFRWYYNLRPNLMKLLGISKNKATQPAPLVTQPVAAPVPVLEEQQA
ncbi:sterol desaturase/sphingolipid hydroxylase (fatty acid hydroxylase superfamily) [Mucilaginibacter yixingensis]|uniref:Sterol desaturase/sphingolipid hydroxylase (Fatty acid hydroxylase superfamily) n=1 Tax=Mucilaginibacter yixingensis TaxID=1295612 RepID=A0A2T5JFA6_9SPHI|nr:sterol desaturase family protein [Mucilaginibacter yixingensis]PTR01120.1 sterol desaturase/sphingolipid hydroxylase (fatty acid hydroxylase superfamily) [Mucilaginibacter yixingensis]